MTSIEWVKNADATQGKTWNPVLGCSHVSAGCDHCYAATLASGRLKTHPLYAGLAEGGKFTGIVRLVPERLEDPLHVRKPTTWFVNSMSDLFHDAVPDAYIALVFKVMAATPHHTYQVLTKRPGRMASVLTNRATRFFERVWEGTGDLELWNRPWPLPNVWLGTSVENQKWADVRIPKLLQTPAAVRFLSCEPLLGPIDLPLLDVVIPTPETPSDGIDWVIVGGESGKDDERREMDVAWCRSIVEQCVPAGVPVFVKQDSGQRPGKQGRLPDDLWSRKEMPDGR